MNEASPKKVKVKLHRGLGKLRKYSRKKRYDRYERAHGNGRKGHKRAVRERKGRRKHSVILNRATYVREESENNGISATALCDSSQAL